MNNTTFRGGRKEGIRGVGGGKEERLVWTKDFQAPDQYTLINKCVSFLLIIYIWSDLMLPNCVYGLKATMNYEVYNHK